MKKLAYLFSLLLAANFIFIGCNSDDDLVVEEGVVINGIRWATRNVDTPGTFAATPGSAGMFYQWNRNTAYATTGDIDNWNTSAASGTEWARGNDPCPSGWRVPTRTEWQSLLNAASSRWVERYGVYGRLFGSAPNQIFLPAVGARGFGIAGGRGIYGFYWSSTQHNRENAIYMGFSDGNTYTGGLAWVEREFAMSIRCVATR